MEPSNPASPPKLEHGIAAPESFLPGPPAWLPWAISLAIFVALVIAWLLYRRFRRKKSTLTAMPPRDFYQPALRALRELESHHETTPLSQVAARSSLTLRTYLAASQNEPALYETVEEFKARAPDLPPAAEAVLTALNEVKYAQSHLDPPRAQALIEQTRACLESLHAASTSPPTER